MCDRVDQLPLFPYNHTYNHIIGDKLINPLVGFYIPIIRIPIKGGRFPIPEKTRLLTMAHMRKPLGISSISLRERSECFQNKLIIADTYRPRRCWEGAAMYIYIYLFVPCDPILLLQWFVKTGNRNSQVVNLPPKRTDSVQQEELKKKQSCFNRFGVSVYVFPTHKHITFNATPRCHRVKKIVCFCFLWMKGNSCFGGFPPSTPLNWAGFYK